MLAVNYALKRRHLSPYVENPFRLAEVGRLLVENARPIRVFDADQEAMFLRACDPWQFPLFLTLLLTGLRPGELIHLALPNDVDLEQGWLRIRNKRQLGWQVKTRLERDVPLVPELRAVLQLLVAGRRRGPLFRQRRCRHGYEPLLGLKQAFRMRRISDQASKSRQFADELIFCTSGVHNSACQFQVKENAICRRPC